MDLLGTIGSGLGYLNDALDKPGRALRGALAGKPREVLAAVPFSDSVGLTDPRQATSGRDLTDTYGLTSRGDHSFGSHAIGFGADVLTDPLNLLAGYGAFKAAPTLAKGIKSGAKALTGLDLLDSIQGGLRGLRGGRKAISTGHLIETTADATPKPDLLRSLVVGQGEAGTIHPATMLQGGSFHPKPRVIGDPSDAESLKSLFSDPYKETRPWWRAAQIAHNEGKPIAPIFPKTWQSKGYKIGDGEALAHYLQGPRAIELNMGARSGHGDSPLWMNNHKMNDMLHHNFQENHFSYDHRDHIVFHELGHALHHDSLGPFDWSTMTAPFSPTHRALISKNVGDYAGTNGAELIAEIYASLRGGRHYHATEQANVAKMLQEYAGTPLLDKMSRQGLLQGVGLSALLSAYGIANQNPESQ